MSWTRWGIFLIALVGMGWLHYLFMVPKTADSAYLWWIYRGLVFILAVSMVISLNSYNKQRIHEDHEDGVESVAAGLFLTLRSSTIVMAPVVLFFLWFAIQVITGKDATFGGDYPVLSLVIGGLMVFVALFIVGVIAAVAGAVGSTIARLCGATPENGALITPIFVYFSLLVASFWY